MIRRWILLLALTAAAQNPLQAGSFVYSSLSAWQTSNPGSTPVLDFESTTIGYYSSFSYSPYNFTPSSGWLIESGGAAAGTGSGRYLTTDSASVLNIALGSGVYGVGFNLGSNSSGPATASILATDVNGIQYLTSNVTTSGPAGPAIFWGLRNDVQLVSVKITFTAVLPQVDNVRYSNTPLPPQNPALPEPAPWALVAGGGVVVLLARHPISKSSKSSRRAGQKRTAVGWHRRSR